MSGTIRMTGHLPSSLLLLVLSLNGAWMTDTDEVVVQMPNVHPPTDDYYMDTTEPIDLSGTYYIIEFVPLATMKIVHHMIVSGCSDAKETTPGHFSCVGSTQLFYAWARDAPTLTLPPGVGFKIGDDSNVKYITVNVHYGTVKNINATTGDTTGVKLIVTKEKQPKRAATTIMVTSGVIRANTSENFETVCDYTADIPIHPFAFRTHTHDHGQLVSGYDIKPAGDDGLMEWIAIGKQNPLLPQFFYPVKNTNITIEKGDKMAARCTMKNDENRDVWVGGGHMNEMCNFYFMFYVEGDELPQLPSCWKPGPPSYYWKDDPTLNNIPPDASQL